MFLTKKKQNPENISRKTYKKRKEKKVMLQAVSFSRAFFLR